MRGCKNWDGSAPEDCTSLRDEGWSTESWQGDGSSHQDGQMQHQAAGQQQSTPVLDSSLLRQLSPTSDRLKQLYHFFISPTA